MLISGRAALVMPMAGVGGVMDRLEDVAITTIEKVDAYCGAQVERWRSDPSLIIIA